MADNTMIAVIFTIGIITMGTVEIIEAMQSDLDKICEPYMDKLGYQK